MAASGSPAVSSAPARLDFEGSPRPTLGVEWEFALVDKATGDLINEATAVIAEVGSPHLALQFDIFHCQIMDGDAEGHLRRQIAAIRHIQIAGVPDRHEPDTGEVDYRRLFAVMDELGYAGYVGCEYQPAGDTVAGLGWFEAVRG